MKKDTPQQETQPYIPPAIIYDGSISTRAGSPLGGGNNNNADGVDPADLFNN